MYTELLSVDGTKLISRGFLVTWIDGGETLLFLPEDIKGTRWLTDDGAIKTDVESLPTQPGWTAIKPQWVGNSVNKTFAQQLAMVQGLDTMLPEGLTAKIPSAEELCFLKSRIWLVKGLVFPPPGFRVRLLNIHLRSSHLVLGNKVDGGLYIGSCPDVDEEPDLGTVVVIRVHKTS